MIAAPEHSLGADLVWWRSADGAATFVSLLWDQVQPFGDAVHLQARLHGDDGRLLAEWRIDLPPGQPVFIDSLADGPWNVARGRDGVLVLHACTTAPPSEAARQHYQRLFPLVDWQLADGRSATLHSDQSVRRGRDSVQRFTEIVVFEDDWETNALVFVNGEVAQEAGALELTVRNAAGDVRSAIHAPAMAPFSLHRVALAALFPGISGFADGAPLQVGGCFRSQGLYTRPYVETTGQRWGVYHGGDVYDWDPLPYVAHAVMGGEVNPVAVRHDARTRTFVNLLNSHGSLEDDVPVDVALFDADGRCVARRPAWRVAVRHGLARFDIAELLDDTSQDFHGHVSLNFAADRRADVPRHLQALMEYRTDRTVAHTMTWSDQWNSRISLARRDRATGSLPQYRSWFRVRGDAGLETEVAIANAGHAGYDRDATVLARYRDVHGKMLETTLTLAPYVTATMTLASLFPDATPATPGMLELESSSDLAGVGYTRHAASGSLACEHTMSLLTWHEGWFLTPAGS